VSSLRPLITITLLAAAGVVLYMKINETEPVIPPGAENWIEAELEIGGDAPAAAGAAAATTSPPAYEADAAPPFVPSGAKASGDASPPATADAPSWSPGPVAVKEEPKKSETPAASAAVSDQSSPIARSAVPEAILPEMPPLPAASASTESAADAPKVSDAPPFTPIDTASVDVLPDTVTPATPESVDSLGVDDAAATAAVEPITPTASTPETTANETTPDSATHAKAAEGSMFASVRVAVEGALDRGELAQALLLLSDWYGDPSLTPTESQEVNSLLGQLAGTVIYEGPPEHRLEPAYLVKSGETLHDVAQKYDVPWQLLAKINRLTDPGSLQPGQELKVVRGPFSALVDLSERKLTLMLDRRYAGVFPIELDPSATLEEGQWKVDQKLLTPAGGGLYGSAASQGEDRSLLLSNPAAPSGEAIVLRGPGNTDAASSAPAGRVIRLKSVDINDLYDILSEKSRVTVRR
jgi:LysM repeat protein